MLLGEGAVNLIRKAFILPQFPGFCSCFLLGTLIYIDNLADFSALDVENVDN